MAEVSFYESRVGRLSGSTDEIFDFVTDIRNFERFVPKETVSDWKAEKDSCSFKVSMLGTISFHISEKTRSSMVSFDGDALKKNDFSLILHLASEGNGFSEVQISLSADLNPMLKMMAAKPIAGFLEMLVNEMEKFDGWKDIKR